MMPSNVKTKRKTNAEFDHLLQVLGAIRMLLHTRWQALGGRKKQHWARQRLQCTHPDFTAAMFQVGPLSKHERGACSSFLATQLDCANLAGCDSGLLYVLCSPRHCYLGSTACTRKVWRCTLSVAMPRFYEHLHEIRLVQRQASHAKHLRKTQLFKNLHLGDMCVWVLCVTRLPMARALETCFLRVGSWPANSQGTVTSLKKPMRRSNASRRVARRAPPRFRHGLSGQRTLGMHVEHMVRCACNSLAKQAATRELQVDMEYLQQAFRLPFHEAYWHVYKHRLALDGTFGPLDLRSLHCESLFARYVCEKNRVCWESIRQRWSLHDEPDGCEAIVAMFALNRQASSHTRARGVRLCNRWLQQHGLPSSHKRKVLWPEKIPRRVLACCQRQIRRQLSQVCSPLLARWFVHTAQATCPPRTTYAKQWNHVRACKNLREETWFNAPAPDLQLTQQEGTLMQLSKLYRRTPVWQSVDEAVSFASASLSAWARSLPVTPDRVWVPVLQGWLHSLQHSSPDLSLHRRYTSLLYIPSGYVAAQEDKDKSSCWILPSRVYYKLFALMVNQDKDHWVRSMDSAASFVQRYRELHVQQLPVHMQYACSLHRWRSWHLPYMYINIKSKCFQSGYGRVCVKPHHACCRRVVSWAAHPCKRIYKHTAKALEAAIRLWGKGFETKDLFSAIRDFRAAVGELRHDHCCLDTCHRCHRSKAPLCLWVGDAAQLFEEVDQRDLLFRLRCILRELQETSNAFGIVTKRNRRLHYWFARNNFRPSHGCQLHRWSEILAISELVLAQTAVRVGPTVYQQRHGVPIGGFMSKQFAAVFLGFSEAQFVQNLELEANLEFVPAGFSFTDVIAATRYVDDLALASSLLCTRCLGELPKKMYAAPIHFDETKPTELGLQWLDVWLRAEGLSLRVHVHGVEHGWRCCAEAGVLDAPGKYRVVPYQGADVMDTCMLVAILSGRLKRLHSLDLDQAHMKRAVDCELQLWVLHGYPLKIVHEVWKRGKHHPAAVQYARTVLLRAISTCGPHARICMPWESSV